MSLSTLIADTREAIGSDASNAQAAFSAEGTLVGVTEVDVTTGTHTFKVDEPPALGGAVAAANPVQYALASLGSCQAITYRFWAEQLGIAVDSVTVRAEGDLDLRGFFGVDETRAARLHRDPPRCHRDRAGKPRSLRGTRGRGGRALPRPRPVPQPGAGNPRPG